MQGWTDSKIAVSVVSVYAAYLTLKCPCKKINSCQLSQYYLATGLALSIVMLDNST